MVDGSNAPDFKWQSPLEGSGNHLTGKFQFPDDLGKHMIEISRIIFEMVEMI